VLRPLIVVTGTLHVDGGASVKLVQRTGTQESSQITHEKTVSPDRARANVIVSDVNRKLRKHDPLLTPFGRLFEVGVLSHLVAIFDETTLVLAEFNRTSTGCNIVNGYVWEHLAGNRRAAVEGWAAYHREADRLSLKGHVHGERARAASTAE